MIILKNGMNVSARTDLSRFTDSTQIHDFAYEAVSWAVSVGLISGTSPDTVSPINSATRAEIPLIVMNYVEKIKSGN